MTTLAVILIVLAVVVGVVALGFAVHYTFPDGHKDHCGNRRFP